MGRELILFCYDGSDDSKRSFEAAADLLSTRQAVVADVGSVLTAAESLGALSPGVDVSELQTLNREAARERAEEGVAYAQRFGFEAQAREVLDEPLWDGILDLADEVDASVIVVGSRGLTGAKKALEHSFSSALAEHSRRPVLIVPPPAAPKGS